MRRRAAAGAIVAAVTLAAGPSCRQIAGIEEVDLPGDGGPRPDVADAGGESLGEGGAFGCACPGCTVLLSGLEQPLSLVLHGAYIYVLDYGPEDGHGSLVRVPTAGGAKETLESKLNRPFSLVDDGTSFFWQAEDTKAGIVVKRPVDATGSAMQTLASGLPPLQGLLSAGNPNLPTNSDVAVTATDVYFVGFYPGSPGGPSPFGIFSVPIDGGAVKPFVSAWPTDAGAPDAGGADGGPGGIVPLGIVTDGKTLFSTILAPNAGVLRAPLPSGPATALVDNLDDPLGLVLVGKNVVFGDATPNLTNGTLQSIAETGGAPSILGKLGAPWALTAEPGAIYFVDANLTLGACSIKRYDLKAKTTKTLASALGEPSSLVVDADSVYWVDPYCGSLMKVAK